MYFWSEDYSVISDAQGLLNYLDEAGLDESCYEELVDAESYFDDFSSMNFPPLCNISDIEYLDGFLHVEEDEDDEDYEDGAPGMSYLFTRIYIEKSKKEAVINAFKKLVKNLESYPPIQEFI